MHYFRRFRREPRDENGAQAGRQHGPAKSAYLLPTGNAEADRLDLQHRLLNIVVGKNYCAPISQPQAILDVACGTGTWAREMALEFPSARVVGFDLQRAAFDRALAASGPDAQPDNFTFLTADALKPFPFGDVEFAFTHARFIVPFVTDARWPQVVGEMLRVTRPGGFLELAEAGSAPVTQSAAFDMLMNAIRRLQPVEGINERPGEQLAGYLRLAGAQDVQERRFVLGTGDDAQEHQRLLAEDFLLLLASFEPLFVRAGVFSEEQHGRLLQQARAEVAQTGITIPIIFAFGQKP